MENGSWEPAGVVVVYIFRVPKAAGSIHDAHDLEQLTHAFLALLNVGKAVEGRRQILFALCNNAGLIEAAFSQRGLAGSSVHLCGGTLPAASAQTTFCTRSPALHEGTKHNWSCELGGQKFMGAKPTYSVVLVREAHDTMLHGPCIVRVAASFDHV